MARVVGRPIVIVQNRFFPDRSKQNNPHFIRNVLERFNRFPAKDVIKVYLEQFKSFERIRNRYLALLLPMIGLGSDFRGK